MTDILKLFPARLLKFNLQKAVPYNVGTPCPWPQSRQGFLTFPVPSGASVAAAAPEGDGTRGTISFWADWWKGLGGSANTLTFAVLKDGDAVPAPYANNPTNARAGRLNISVDALATGYTNAQALVGAINASMGMLGIDAKFARANGKVAANPTSPPPQTGAVYIVSPVPWRAMKFTGSSSGAWSDVGITEFPSTYRGFLVAGVRPAPWMVQGAASLGLGDEHSIIG